MKDETRQTKIQANIFQKSSIIVERFAMSCCYTIAQAQTHTVADRAVTS